MATIDRDLMHTGPLGGSYTYRDEYWLAESLKSSTLVSSRIKVADRDPETPLEDFDHAPALDLDYAAQLLIDEDGRSWLHLEPAANWWQRLQLGWALRRAGAVAPGRPSGALRVDRHAAATAAIVDELASHQFDGGFADLVDTARRLCESEPRTGQIAVPTTGMLLALRCDALLLESSTAGHHHLYLEVALTGKAYSRLLKRLGRAGAIEPGYADVSIQTGWTVLRQPNVRKGVVTADGCGSDCVAPACSHLPF